MEPSVTAQLLLLRDLPGIQALEDRYLLNARSGADDFNFDHTCWRLACKLFGLEEGGLRPDWPAGVDEDHPDFEAHLEAEIVWWSQFECPSSDVERIAFFSARGWDVTDGHGHALYCLDNLAVPLEAVIKGLAGHLPREEHQLDEEELERKLRGEVARFRSGHR